VIGLIRLVLGIALSGFGLGLTFGGLLATLLKPLRVSHLAARGQPAHPGTMRAFGKVHRNAELAGCHSKPAHVVGVLVGDDDCVQSGRIFVGQLHAAEQLSAAQPGVY